MQQHSHGIVPCLWFDGRAEEAAVFYVSLFEDARIVELLRYGEAGPGPAGSVLTVEFELRGQRFVALNGGTAFAFSPAISFSVNCETQDEIDRLWHRLLEGGAPQQCGWLTDRFGVSWQIVPRVLPEMLRDADAARSQRVMRTMLGMVKLDIAALRAAYAG